MAEEDGDKPNPVKKSPLKELVKAQKDFRISSEAADELILDLEYLAETIWVAACSYAEDDNLQTVRAEHIEKAFDELLRPHDLLLEAATDLEDMKEQMMEYREQSPIESHW